jgi:hypothetical protein
MFNQSVNTWGQTPRLSAGRRAKSAGNPLRAKPEVLVLELGDLESTALKLRILWWTKAPRQHQMLTSYDGVLTAIRQTLDRYMAERNRPRERAA